MKFVVHTEIDKRNHIIKQSVNCVGDASFQDLRQHISTQVFRLQEKQLREALIRMGWTPPPDAEENSDE